MPHMQNFKIWLDFQFFWCLGFFGGHFQCIQFGNIKNEGSLDTIIWTLSRPCCGCLISKILVEVLFCFVFYV
jgi:hypothetical protein